jgi:hypothetical protein
MLWRKEKSLALAGNLTPAIQPAAHRYFLSSRIQSIVLLTKNIRNVNSKMDPNEASHEDEK